jgi:NAD(P)-dependent dehydrogenase (short-subunit alcohol dehydrogenase family)
VLSNIDLRGLRIAVTGGTSGLGLALVRNLAASRARVAFVARRPQQQRLEPGADAAQAPWTRSARSCRRRSR